MTGEIDPYQQDITSFIGFIRKQRDDAVKSSFVVDIAVDTARLQTIGPVATLAVEAVALDHRLQTLATRQEKLAGKFGFVRRIFDHSYNFPTVRRITGRDVRNEADYHLFKDDVVCRTTPLFPTEVEHIAEMSISSGIVFDAIKARDIDETHNSMVSIGTSLRDGVSGIERVRLVRQIDVQLSHNPTQRPHVYIDGSERKDDDAEVQDALGWLIQANRIMGTKLPYPKSR